MPKWYEAKVESVKNLNKNTKEFKLKVCCDERFDFRPGQFITMDLPVGQKRLDCWKSYSIANLPNVQNVIELAIVRLPEGLGTQYLFEKVEIGTSIKLKGPEGQFILPADLSNPITMICTGTGIVPFRSMLMKIRNDLLDFNDIHLIFGSRYSEEVLYRAELEEMARVFKCFKYTISLSREDTLGDRGYVHRFYLEYGKEIAQKRKYFLCGWQKMIDEAQSLLTKNLEVSPNQIYFELYG